MLPPAGASSFSGSGLAVSALKRRISVQPAWADEQPGGFPGVWGLQHGCGMSSREGTTDGSGLRWMLNCQFE